jgi:hypothetical protein
MKKPIILLALLCSFFIVKAQIKDVHISLEGQAGLTTNSTVPFWLRANQFGSVPLSGGSGSLIAKIRKDYDTTKTFGWGFSFEGRGNAGKDANFTLIEGLVKAHAGVFELRAGRSKDIVGLTDSTLSSGSFSVSGNALGVPKISLGIPQYYSIPIFGKLFAVKANLGVGYMGNVDISYRHAMVNNSKAYYLENGLYARIGMPSWRFNMQVGFNHEALWGDEKDIFPNYRLTGSETLWHVLIGQVYHHSKVGNHLGSLDVGASYRFDDVNVLLYRQNLYDKGALSSLANIADGLNGLSITNTRPNNGNFYWKKMVFELFYTVNQAGGLNAKRTNSGYENYYNNYEYSQGWSYNGMGLGNPFITTREDGRQNLPSSPREYFINNRVTVFHAASQLYLYKWFYTAKLSYSINKGNYSSGTSNFVGSGGDIIKPGLYGVFKQVNQFSAYLEGIRPLNNGYNIGYDLGYDQGGLLNNSFGIILKVSKSFM